MVKYKVGMFKCSQICQQIENKLLKSKIMIYITLQFVLARQHKFFQISIESIKIIIQVTQFHFTTYFFANGN